MRKGFTLVEILLVVVIVAILIAGVLVAIRPATLIEKGHYRNASISLKSIAKAANLYAARYGYYPEDVWRDIPQAFTEYLNPGSWPDGPFPGSVYDWENWEGQTCWDGSTGIIQITLRQVDYEDKTDYTLYWVIQGDGVPHCSDDSVRGECLNCESRYP